MEDRYRQIFQHAACGILLLDLDGRILDFNPSACRLAGPERGTLRLRPLGELFSARFAQAFPEKLKLLQQLGHLTLETSLKAGRGTGETEILLDLTQVPLDEGQGVLVLLYERGGRDALEQEAYLQRLILQALWNGRAVLLVLLEADGAARLYPPADDRDGAPFGLRERPKVLPLFQEPRVKEACARAWAGEPVTLPPHWVDLDSYSAEPNAQVEERSEHGRLLGLTLLPLPARDGTVGRVLGVVSDETEERMKAEAQRHLDQRAALALFSSALFHEFNSYLGAIMAQASSLRLSTPPGQLVSPPLGAILDASQSAAALLRRAYEIGHATLAGWGPFSLNRCVREAARVLEHSLHERIRVNLELSDGLPEVWGDADLLAKAIIALGRLAEAHMPAGGTLVLKTYPVEPPSPAARLGAGLSISDTGVGMDAMARAQSLASLFPSATTGPGDPLDLAFARAVIHQHRGQCELDSAPGRGSVWRLVLPGEETRPRLTGPLPMEGQLPNLELLELHLSQAATGAALATLARPLARPNPYESGGRPVVPPRLRPRLLLADDEENFRDFGRAILGQGGYEVVVAADGLEAFERVQEDPARFALVILDAYMPRLGGLEAYLRMQALRSDLPVIFVSGFVRGHSRDALVTACPGRAEVLLKPFSGEQLTQAVEKALKGLRVKSG